MRQFHSCIAILSLMIFTGTQAYAKPRSVYLSKELKNAAFIGVVVIDGYSSDSSILFHSIEHKDTIKKAVTNYKGPGGYEFGDSRMKMLTGYWPCRSDTVLIVINSIRRVSLFAKKSKTDYRFWSPYFTLSAALFYFSSPATHLPTGKERRSMNCLDACWDGCLLPVDQLFTASARMFSCTGKAMIEDGKAVLVCDLCDNAVFYPEGLKKWDEKYLNKKVRIAGELVTDSGKNVLVSWKILE